METTLTFKTAKAFDQKRNEIRDMIGIEIPFQNPYYLFFSIEDLSDENEDNVYFVGYEMKSPGPAFWGYVDKEDYHITIKGSCWYRTNLLNDMVKQWKRNNLKYTGSAVKNRSYPRIEYELKDLNKKYKMDFTQFEEEKYFASFYRGEIEWKDIRNGDNMKWNRFLEKIGKMTERQKIDYIKEIDKKNQYETIEIDEKQVQVPKILSDPDYQRYKAFWALLDNKITKKQFEKLYPWNDTLEILNSLIYDFFGQVEEIGTQEYFWELYPKETKEFLKALLEQITIYETKMNRIDSTYSFMVDILNEFFEQLQTRKIKINPTENCPTITDCETLSGDFDKSVEACKVYYYPEGQKVKNLR
jgi:hypothetical protein